MFLGIHYGTGRHHADLPIDGIQHAMMVRSTLFTFKFEARTTNDVDLTVLVSGFHRLCINNDYLKGVHCRLPPQNYVVDPLAFVDHLHLPLCNNAHDNHIHVRLHVSVPAHPLLLD